MSLLNNAKALRSHMTPHELMFWQYVRAGRLNGYKFRRQQPMGRYVVDFVCHEARLVVELDGSQHLGAPADTVRDAWLNQEGYQVMRFWNNELTENLDGVLQAVLRALNARHPLPLSLSPQGRGRM